MNHDQTFNIYIYIYSWIKIFFFFYISSYQLKSKNIQSVFFKIKYFIYFILLSVNWDKEI